MFRLVQPVFLFVPFELHFVYIQIASHSEGLRAIQFHGYRGRGGERLEYLFINWPSEMQRARNCRTLDVD